MIDSSVPSHGEAGVDAGQPILEVSNLEVVYDRVITAIQGVSLAVPTGSITAVIGTNGAGKSTLLKAIGGFLAADDVEIAKGSIMFQGRDILGWPPHKTARAGIALIPERDKIFPRLTVYDNLAVCDTKNDASFGIEEAYDLFPVLHERRSQVSGYLSGGERQMLAMSMALMGGAELLLIDEMSLGLSPAMSDRLGGIVRKLRDERGLSVLLVEQDAVRALGLVDYAYVMENGRVVFKGAPDVLRRQSDFMEFYLGLGESEQRRRYGDVKQYKRHRRWFA
jgi:branched-chain amino acid transport system ATP-binding protein